MPSKVLWLNDTFHPMLTLADIGEVGFLARLKRALPRATSGVAMGVGDDAALLRGAGPLTVLSCDMLLEGVDFERAWASPRDIGHKAAAANLSDLAAMGAQPRALLAAVALRPDEQVRDVLTLLRSLDATGRRFGAPLVGGDISKTTGPLVVSVTAVGRVGKHVLRRAAARVGDLILVSGTLGEAALGLALLQAGKRAPLRLTRRQLRPEPQVALGMALARRALARAGADISDGLAKDAMHLITPDRGIELDVRALPLSKQLLTYAPRMACSPSELALSGGEDFELVVAVAQQNVAAAQRVARALGTTLTAVGRVVRRPGLHCVGERGLVSHVGFDHFA